jgi:hypothetical protein
MITIHADKLQPGDVVVYGGHDRRITRVDRRDGWAWPIAADGTGWAIALDHRLIHVHRDAARFHLSVATETLDEHANQVTEHARQAPCAATRSHWSPIPTTTPRRTTYEDA